MSFSFISFIRKGSLLALKRHLPSRHKDVINVCLSRIDESVDAFADYTHEHANHELINPIIPPREQYSMWLRFVGMYRRLCLLHYMQHILQPHFWDWPPSHHCERVYVDLKQEIENMLLMVHPGQHIRLQQMAIIGDIIEVGCLPSGVIRAPVLWNGGGLFQEARSGFLRNQGLEK